MALINIALNYSKDEIKVPVVGYIPVQQCTITQYKKTNSRTQSSTAWRVSARIYRWEALLRLTWFIICRSSSSSRSSSLRASSSSPSYPEIEVQLITNIHIDHLHLLLHCAPLHHLLLVLHVHQDRLDNLLLVHLVHHDHIHNLLLFEHRQILPLHSSLYCLQVGRLGHLGAQTSEGGG